MESTYKLIVISVIVLIVSFQHFTTWVCLLITLLIVHINAIFIINFPKKVEKPIVERFSRFQFTRSKEWAKECQNLKDSNRLIKLNDTAYEENINKLIDLIIRDFIQTWFNSISQDDSFPNEVRNQIVSIVNTIDERFSKIDLSKLIVLKMLPLLTNHFQNYLKSKDVVLDEMKQSNDSSIGLNEFNFKIIKEFKDLNGLNEFIELRNDEIEKSIKNYSNDRLNKIIPFLIPNEIDSSLIKNLSTELILNFTLKPILKLLSDSDFWNGLIIKYSTIILKDRNQIRELKKIIDKQTSTKDPKPDSTTLQNKIMIRGRRINPQMKKQEFEKYLKMIENSNNLTQLKQLKYLNALQINRTNNLNSNSPVFLKYRQRLHIAKDLIELKINELINHDEGLMIPKRNSLVFNETNDLQEFISNLTLFQILKNPSALPFFTEFMKQRDKVELLNFWIAVDKIKDPLEDPRIDIEEDFSFEDVSFSSSQLEVNLKDVEEIKNIFKEFFQKKKLEIDIEMFEKVARFYESDDYRDYNRIRKLIIFKQIEIFKKIEKFDFKDFKNSDFFLKLLLNETFEESLISEVDNLEEYNNQIPDDEETESDFESSKNDDQSLLEIENALNTILTKPDMNFESSSSSLMNQGNKSTDKLKNELFGGTEQDFLNGKSLFKDEDEELTNTDLITEETLEIQNDFIKPTHDKFNLKQEITKLNDEIIKLNKQSSILDPLILKCELMNNSQELRLLKKSKSSYQREIESKELMKQQLIVQDNENSLFGKTNVVINSWVKGKDEQNNSKEFIVYLIEIEKENEDIKSNWVIGRRFNQFWKLNEHLKKKFPNSSNSLNSFPKKKIVLKFQEKSIIDERRKQLEKYINELLQNSIICQDKEFRKFLTLQDYSQNELSTNPSIKDTAKNLYNGLYSSIDILSSRNLSEKSMGNPPLEEDQENLESSITSLQSNTATNTATNTINNTTNSSSFIKPIIEMFTALFPLSNQTNNWIRGQAILLILQQVFGSTIENHLKTMIHHTFSEEKLNELLISLRGLLWPNDVFFKKSVDEGMKDEREVRKEKIKNFSNSKKLLNDLIVDVFSKIIDFRNCEAMSGKVHGMLQVDVLNLQMVVEVFDLLLVEIFDELNGEFS